jgi:class 3 adenylate cyclase
VERRLAAVLAADVAGYSRLMGMDEEGTLAQLKGHRQALVDPKIEEHRGRIVKTTGDGMLVEFASVVDAVRCAVEVQRGMSERNARLSVDKRIEFRVGINLGDIIIDDDDIYGDGVNIAARLEGIAEPGGICISRQAHDHLLEKTFVYLREAGAAEPQEHCEARRSLFGELRFRQHDAGDQILPSARWGAPCLCNRGAGFTSG